MDVEASGGTLVWNGVIGIALAYIVHTARKRDDLIDDNAKGVATLAVKLEQSKTEAATTYATKQTMMDLYKETTRTNEMAIARVEKSIENTNATITKQGDKLDSVALTISQFQTTVMAELAKKT